MILRPIAAASAALALTACATATTGEAPVPIPANLAARSHVATVLMTSDWLRAEEDFSDTFTDEISQALGRCARGPQGLMLRVHVSKVRRDGRLGALLNGGGEHELAAVAEFVEPGTRTVVGRYPIHVVVDAGGPAEILLADRQLMVADAFGAELCRQAFGEG